MPNSDAVRERIALLRNLRAVRDFTSEPVPQAALDDILEIARWTGTASNRQYWELVVVRDRNILKRLSGLEGYLGHLAGAQIGIVLVMAGTMPNHEPYDEGRLSERIMLAAEAHGLGSCIGWLVGGGQTDAKTLLGIPAVRFVRTVISIGYPDDDARAAGPKNPSARKPRGDFVHFDRFN